ncbi:MAG: glutamate--tRNA ligase [Patescibacteria group bacterium]
MIKICLKKWAPPPEVFIGPMPPKLLQNIYYHMFLDLFFGKKIITRFAPSPTGELHIGGVRTALFGFLFAKNQGGKFLLRIEDTDRERFVDGSVEHIIEALDWLGLIPDNRRNIMFQSKRLDIYKKYAFDLVKAGHAYVCVCDKEKLEYDRQRQIEEKKPPKYEGHCRNKNIKIGDIEDGDFVIRMKMPLSGKIKFNDLIREDVEFDFSLLDDQIILKSDGYPTYHLASVVDDHEMGVTHVIRADEWLASTPKHIVLYGMFGWKIPFFAHLPMILAPDKSKLSKRHGATGVFEYKNLGYLPEAIINFLALLGWHSKEDKEIMNFKEILKEFSLNRVQKGAAIFDIKKLNWMNSQYIKEKSGNELLPLIEKLHGKEFIGNKNLALKILDIGKMRMEKLSDFKILKESFDMAGDYDINLLKWKKDSLENAQKNLKQCAETLKILLNHEFNQANLEKILMPIADSQGRGEVLWPLRVALSGKEKSPSPFEIMHVIGKEEALCRIGIAIKKISRE